jgi:O-6-methylguanine DNA methyltransferase
MKELYYFTMSWEPCDILVAGTAGAVRRLNFLRGCTAEELLAPLRREYALVKDQAYLPDVQEQLRRYFAGEQVKWQVTLELDGGTDFQRSVWSELQKIPYGSTITYAGLAAKLGKPGAMRAVGGANGANPIAIIIPCHRVVAANHKLGGFGGGLEAKQALLQLEGISL